MFQCTFSVVSEQSHINDLAIPFSGPSSLTSACTPGGRREDRASIHVGHGQSGCCPLAWDREDDGSERASSSWHRSTTSRYAASLRPEASIASASASAKATTARASLCTSGSARSSLLTLR